MKKMSKLSQWPLLIFLSATLCLAFSLSMILIVITITNMEIDSQIAQTTESRTKLKIIKLKENNPLPTPEKVKGIYLTGYTFSLQERREELSKLIEDTELNAMVIDTRDPNSKLMFRPISEKLQTMIISPVAPKNDEFKQILTDLQNKKIYTIARISTFQDNWVEKSFPDLALKNKQGGIWKNWQGIAWFDMTNPNSWDIPIELAKEAIKLGFDEIQFDYIRFPSDGRTEQIQYYNLSKDKKKYEILTNFYQYLSTELKELNIPLSIDLFGLTYQNHENGEYDLNIGQRLVDACPYFDYISPMVYPSHYPENYLGFSNPATQPYIVIYKALQEGNQILANTPSSKALTRPWLQDFHLGAIYDARMVKEQIRASEENNTAGWLLWNPSNIYTVQALTIKEQSP